MKRVKKAIKIVIFNLILCLIVLFLFEISLRLISYDKNEQLALNIRDLGGKESNNSILSFEPTPSFSKEIYQLNSDGLRDYEINITKSPKIYRIAVLGDSVSYGVGVNLSDTFAKVLEKKLGENYEVVNFGFGGYNTFQEAEYLTYKVKKYNPDFIILEYTLNDFEPIVKKEDCKINLINLPINCKLKNSLYKIKVLYLLRNTIYTIQSKNDDFYNLVDSISLDKKRWGEDVSLPLQIFYNNSLEITGKKPLLVIVPMLYNLDDYQWNYIHQNVTFIASEIGFKT